MYCSLISLSAVVDRYSVEPVQTDSPFNERSCSNPTDSSSLISNVNSFNALDGIGTHGFGNIVGL